MGHGDLPQIRKCSKSDSEGAAEKSGDCSGECGGMKCFYCNSVILRRSRLRRSDIFWLLKFQYPIRCRECHTRTHVPVLQALKLKAAGKGREHGQGDRATESKESAPKST